MATIERRTGATHEVFNQPPALQGHNVFTSDPALVEALRREGGEWAEQRAIEAGELAGRPEIQELGVLANRNTPILRTHDRSGNRIDEVEFDSSWHALMKMGTEFELHSLPWTTQNSGGHVARATLFYVLAQVEAGFGCPISMTYSCVPAIRMQPEIAAEWEPKLTSSAYDPTLRPVAEKPGALCGMAMTERQGGSDVRANTTVAIPLNGGGPGAEYELTGHKWFCSAPMCDVFLVLAQTDSGLSCFLLPRILPDGGRNRFHIQRLKDKLGNRSNASSEIEFDGAWARMVGEEGRGVPTIIEMVNHTRLDCSIGSAAGMRHGVAAAAWHASHRSAFGAVLAEQPLMRNVLADLAVESEAATVSAMRLARSYDLAASDEHEREFRRVANAVLKYWICKRAPAHAAEALECLGGAGYVEDSGMPRLFRESPVSSIWEGSGNVQCLDVLRAMSRNPEAVGAFFAEIGEAAGADSRLDVYVKSLQAELADTVEIESRARRIVERMALALQGSLLVRWGDPAVADAFCASRLAGDWGRAFGTLPAGTDHKAIVARHTPS